MATDPNEQLVRLAGKTEVLLTRYRTLLTRLERLADENRQLRIDLRTQTARAQKLEIDNQYLRVATTLARDRETQDKAHAILKNLVREIDKCITDLNV